jgi:hypothetical protein
MLNNRLLINGNWFDVEPDARHQIYTPEIEEVLIDSYPIVSWEIYDEILEMPIIEREKNNMSQISVIDRCLLSFASNVQLKN